jgi:membrane-associated phospholipid phosphatase
VTPVTSEIRYKSSVQKHEAWLDSIDILVLLFQGVLSLVVLLGDLPTEQKVRWCAFHVLVCAALLMVLWAIRDFSNPVVLFLKGFYPIIIMLLFFREIGQLVHTFFDWTMDEWLLHVDNELGQLALSIWNFQQFYPPSPVLNEFFNISYSFYFILIPMSAALFFLNAPYPRYRTFMFSVTFTYYLNYLTFIFLPADSPRFFMPGLQESLQGFWVSDWLQGVVANNAFVGGSFPSSHISVAVICFAAFPFLKRWRIPVIFMIFFMFVGTIYARYHYFVDVLGGLALGFLCYFLAPWLEKRRPFTWNKGEPDRGRTQ